MAEENVEGAISLDRNTLRRLQHNNHVLALWREGDTNLGRKESLRKAGLVGEFLFMTSARFGDGLGDGRCTISILFYGCWGEGSKST